MFYGHIRKILVIDLLKILRIMNSNILTKFLSFRVKIQNLSNLEKKCEKIQFLKPSFLVTYYILSVWIYKIIFIKMSKLMKKEVLNNFDFSILRVNKIFSLK